jgi:hypothetical protein
VKSIAHVLNIDRSHLANLLRPQQGAEHFNRVAYENRLIALIVNADQSLWLFPGMRQRLP